MKEWFIKAFGFTLVAVTLASIPLLFLLEI